MHEVDAAGGGAAMPSIISSRTAEHWVTRCSSRGEAVAAVKTHLDTIPAPIAQPHQHVEESASL